MVKISRKNRWRPSFHGKPRSVYEPKPNSRGVTGSGPTTYQSSPPQGRRSGRYVIGKPSSGSTAEIARIADRTAHTRDDRGHRLGHRRSNVC